MWCMKFRNNLPAVEEVKNTDIVDYLATLGFKPSKISRNDYWFISPFRDEKTASFKVNRALNRWYDFGEGRGGNLIDFGILYFNCTVSDFLKQLPFTSVQNEARVSPPKQREAEEGLITILR